MQLSLILTKRLQLQDLVTMQTNLIMITVLALQWQRLFIILKIYQHHSSRLHYLLDYHKDILKTTIQIWKSEE